MYVHMHEFCFLDVIVQYWDIIRLQMAHWKIRLFAVSEFNGIFDLFLFFFRSSEKKKTIPSDVDQRTFSLLTTIENIKKERF